VPKNDLIAEPGVNKAAVLKQALDKITKAYGVGAIWSALETEIPQTEAVSTGAITLDKALGIGG
jgi:RecA/RadA recombinase